MIKADASVQVKVHHEDSNTSEESFDVPQQNVLCEATCDKEVTLIINIQGSCSTRTTSHSIKVRHCFSAAKSLSLAYSKPTNQKQEGSTRYQPETYRGGSTRRG